MGVAGLGDLGDGGSEQTVVLWVLHRRRLRGYNRDGGAGLRTACLSRGVGNGCAGDGSLCFGALGV